MWPRRWRPSGRINEWHRILLRSFAICLLIALPGLLLSVRLDELESGYFSDFTRSVIEDGDLNIINQVRSEDAWLATRNYNHPTHLDHGTAVLWAPFYALTKELRQDQGAERRKIWGLDSWQLMGVARNALFATLALLLMIATCRDLVPDLRNAGRICFAVALATPLPWYLWLQPFNTEITVLFLSAILIRWIVAISRGQEASGLELFLLGTFMGVAGASKTSMLLLLPAPLACFAGANSTRPASRLLRPLFHYAAGVISTLLLLVMNHQIQTGRITLFPHLEVSRQLAHLAPLALPMIATWPNSLLGCSPIFAAFLAILAIRTPNRPRTLGVLGLASFQFTAIIATTLAGLITYPDEIFSRLLTPLIPVLALQFSWTWSSQRRYGRALIFLTWAACMAVNWLHIAEFLGYGEITGGPHHIPVVLSAASRLGEAVHQRLLHIGELAGLFHLWPQLLGFSAIALGLVHSLLLSGRHGLQLLAAVLFLGYTAVTGLNSINNPRNVERLAESGFFQSTVISNGEVLDHYDEVLSVIDRGERLLTAPWNSMASAQKYEFLQRLEPDVRTDPIGFIEDLRAGRSRKSITR